MDLDELVVAAQTDDSRAWTRLAKRLIVELERYFQRRVGGSDTDDLVQATLVIVHRNLPEFQVQPGRPFRCWLRAIARVQVLDGFRKQHQRDRLADRLVWAGGTPATGLSSCLDRVLRFELIQQELAKLDGLYRRALLHELDDGDAGTLADLEGIARGSARTRKQRAHELLRKRLRRRGALTDGSSPPR